MQNDGYRRNALGHLVPEDQIKPVDKLRDDLVTELVQQAKVAQQQLAAYKAETMQKIADFTDLSAEEYGVSWGGTKGNVTLVSFDGRYKVIRAKGEHRVFDERIQAAKKLIDQCIERWSDGASSELKALVDHAFRVNKQGNIDVNQVLSLRKLDIDDAEWKEAMEAIAESIQINGSSSYLRIYERQGDGAYKQISLDVSKL